MTTTEEVYDGTFGGTGVVDVPAGGASGGALGLVYCSLDQLKAQLGIPLTDTRSDLTLEGIIEAVSRLIDSETRTQFYASTDTLYYTPFYSHELLTHDILSVSSLESGGGDGTYGTVWAPTDYVLAPYNNATSSQPRPFWRIETVGRYSFPAGVLRGVKAVVRRGFSEIEAVPKMVEVVCLRESLHQAQANVTPYGMTAGDGGGAAATTSVSLSNYSKMMLAEFKHLVVP